MSTGAIDEARLEQFIGRMAEHVTGAIACFSIWLGDELGLYRALARESAISADELADETGCHPRLVREWLDGQAAGGLIAYDPASDTYELSAGAAPVLADDSSPFFMARGMNALAAMFVDHAKIAAAFRGDGALGWGDHDPCLFVGNEWYFRTGYRNFLPHDWIPALEGVEAKLESGAKVADVGCGHGASVIALAEAYPRIEVWGFDVHAPSIATARSRAAHAGVADRTFFDVAPADGYQGTFDLICFFDCLHDMGDPVGAATYAGQHLQPDGTVLLVEPYALDDRPANLTANPRAALFYAASVAVCTPNSLSQKGRRALGAQAGAARLRDVFEEAGFTRFRRVASSPMNLIFEGRP